MPNLSRRQKWAGLDAQQTFNVIADDLDELEEDATTRDARVGQLKVIAGSLLIAVCTGIITAFATGVIK